MTSFLSLFLGVLPFAIAAPSSIERRSAPTVELSYATVVGSSLLGVDSFTGIPFAQPPVGELRLKPPQPITSNLGTLQLPLEAQACPQFFFQDQNAPLLTEVLGDLVDNPLVQVITDAGEDCLTVNIRRPSTATADSKLPVVFWIFGGGFELGSTQMYDGSEIVANSITQGKDVLFVAVNYRVGGFGFLAGKEILADGSSNLGLLDQRLGLQWVADNVALFGGDPDKVTIWGESAGSISVFDQMALYNGNITYKGKDLFRGAIMDSGSVIPADPVDGTSGQAIYDTVVSAAGCSAAADTLACLRTVDYETLLSATNAVPGLLGYHSIALSYIPRPDGTVLTESPDALAKEGLFAPVPFIIGDQEDEGTLFALFQSNITTTAELTEYLTTIFFPTSSAAEVEELVNLYPDDITAGSPFRTGILNSVYPQFKRLAAILGDITFTLARRAFLENANRINPTVPTWSYLASYDYGLPILGTSHGSDITEIGFILPVPTFSSETIQSYYISFFNDLTPNNANGPIDVPEWPQWSESNTLINFLIASNEFITDNFREAAGVFVANTTLKI